MAGRTKKSQTGSDVAAGEHQTLIVLPGRRKGRGSVHNLVGEDAEAATTDEDINEALSAIGDWSDLDWDEMEAELYRIGHETPPSLPIEP